MTRNERRRRRETVFAAVIVILALTAAILAILAGVDAIFRTLEGNYTTDAKNAAEGVKTAFMEVEQKAEKTAREADLDAIVLEAMLARCECVENCWIVGYAPELVEGWKEEYRNERGLYLTASGAWCAPGFTVATDPEVIPTGATVIIEGRIYTAADRGVKGKVIDVMVTPEEALVYGARKADVYWMMGEGEE